MLHEIGHALGRVPENVSTFNTYYSELDLWRLKGYQTYLFDGTVNPPPQGVPLSYFSVDGGISPLADWGSTSDPSDFRGPNSTPASNLTPGDPFNEDSSSSDIPNLTTTDLLVMEALGFNANLLIGIAVPPPVLISIIQPPIDGHIVPRDAAHNQSFAASSLFTASAPDGLSLTQYGFLNIGNGGGHFVLDGVAQAEDQEIDVAPSQLGELSYQSGSGTDTLWARVSVGDQWSPWSQSFTVIAPIDTGPTVVPTSANISASHNQSFAVSSLFIASDPFNDPITQYDFWNAGTGGGHFVLNNQLLGTSQENLISASQLSQTTYQSGSGTDMLWVRVSEGSQWSPWSQSFTVTAPVDTGPSVVPTSTNVSATHNQCFAVSSLFIASDPFNDPITQYDFWNAGTGGGHFVLNNQVLGTSQENLISVSQLSQTTYQPDSGTDPLWVRVSDGSQWSPWSQSFTVTAPIDTGPVVTSVSNINTASGQTFAASTLFTTSDPFNDPIEQYDFWDTGAGGGHFVVHNQALGTNQNNYISAAQIGQASYVSGSGTDTLWVRVSEGGQWSPWSPSFTVSDPTTIGTGETLELTSTYTGQLSFTANTGTLRVDNSASFAGTVAGMTGHDAIVFADIDPTKAQAPSYSGDASGGTLSVTDGTHTANIALIGSYLASAFVASSDGHGGTNVVEHAPTGQTALLAQPQH